MRKFSQQTELTAAGRMAIGDGLKAIYQHDKAEPLPRRLAELLEALEAWDETAGRSLADSKRDKAKQAGEAAGPDSGELSEVGMPPKTIQDE